MSTGTKLVGATQFERETGLTRQTFYNLLDQMRGVGVASKDQRKIDLNCEWMRSYLERNRKRNLGESLIDYEDEETDEEIAASVPTYDPNKPPSPDRVEQMIRVETLNKLMIENAIKAKRVIAKVLVMALYERIDDAWSKIIMDGEASFVPQLMQKIKAGCTDEDAKKFWRSEIGKILGPVKPFMKRSIDRAVNDK